MLGNRATRPALLTAAVLVTAAACGPTTAERLAGTIVGPGGALVSTFEADLEAGRIEEALQRTTPAFRAGASAESVRKVTARIRETLGARTGRGSLGVEDVSTWGNPARADGGTFVYDAPFENGAATVRARLEYDVARRVWEIDDYEVRTATFTWTLRR